MKDQLDQILTEYIELHNLTKEEVKVEPLPSMRTVPLPPLKYRAKHLKDKVAKPNRPDINNKRKKKYKKTKYPYIRSRRLQGYSMTDRQADMRTLADGGWHLDNFTCLKLTDARPTCLMCDLPPRTIGDLVFSLFTPFYKCEVCFSIRPFQMATKSNPNDIFFPPETTKKVRRHSALGLGILKQKIKRLQDEDKKWL